MRHVWWLTIFRVPNVQVFPTKTSFVLVHLTDVTRDANAKACCCGVSRLWLCWITLISTCYIWMDDTVIWQEKKHLQLCSIVVILWGCTNIMRFTRCLPTQGPFRRSAVQYFHQLASEACNNCCIFCIPSWYPKHWSHVVWNTHFSSFFHVMLWSHPTETTTFKVDVSSIPGCSCTRDDRLPHQSQVNWIDWLWSPDKVVRRCTRKNLFFEQIKNSCLICATFCNLVNIEQAPMHVWNFSTGVAHHGNKLLQHDVKLLRFFFWFGSSEWFQHSKHLVISSQRWCILSSKGHGQTCKNQGVGSLVLITKCLFIGWYHFQASNLNSI